jgi:uncharacterized phage-associated protein
MANERPQHAEPIRFAFDERKAAEVAAYLLKLHGGEMNYMRLIKLMYVAERVSLTRYGRPIAGDRYVSMKHGPVLSEVYRLIRQEKPGRWWSELIGPLSRYEVRLRTTCDFGSLCDAEIEILDEVSRLYRTMDQFHLRDMTHEEFEEWEDPGDTSREIPVEKLLRVLKKGEMDIRKIGQAAREKEALDTLFGV